MKISKEREVVLGILLIATVMGSTQWSTVNASASPKPFQEISNRWGDYSPDARTEVDSTESSSQQGPPQVVVVTSSNSSGGAPVTTESPGTITVYGYWEYVEQDGVTARPARFARLVL